MYLKHSIFFKSPNNATLNLFNIIRKVIYSGISFFVTSNISRMVICKIIYFHRKIAFQARNNTLLHIEVLNKLIKVYMFLIY